MCSTGEACPSRCPPKIVDHCYRIPSCLRSSKPKEPTVPCQPSAPISKKWTLTDVESWMGHDMCHLPSLAMGSEETVDDPRSWSLSSHCRGRHFLDQMGKAMAEDTENKNAGPELAEIVTMEPDDIHEIITPSGPSSKSNPIEAPITTAVTEAFPSAESPSSDYSASPSGQVDGNVSQDEGYVEDSFSSDASASPTRSPQNSSDEINSVTLSEISEPNLASSTEDSTLPRSAGESSDVSTLPQNSSDEEDNRTEVGGSVSENDGANFAGGQVAKGDVDSEELSVLQTSAMPLTSENEAVSEVTEITEEVTTNKSPDFASTDETAGIEDSVPETLAGAEGAANGTSTFLQDESGVDGQNAESQFTEQRSAGREMTGQPENFGRSTTVNPDTSIGQCDVPPSCTETLLLQEIQKLSLQNAALETRLDKIVDSGRRSRSNPAPGESKCCRPKPPCCQVQSKTQSELLEKLGQLKTEKAELVCLLESDQDEELDDGRERLIELRLECDNLQKLKKEKEEDLTELTEINGARDCQLKTMQNRMDALHKCLTGQIEEVKGQLMAETMKRREAENELQQAKTQLQRQLVRDKCYLEQNLKLMRQLELIKQQAQAQTGTQGSNCCSQRCKS